MIPSQDIRIFIFQLFLCYLNVNSCFSNNVNYNIKLITEFFKEKQIYFVDFHQCGPTNLINHLQILHNNGIRSKSIEYYNINYFHHRFGFVTNVDCNDWDEFVEKELSQRKFHTQKYGLIFCDSHNKYERIKAKLLKFDFKLDSNVYVAIKSNFSYFFYEVHNVLSTSKRILTKSAFYLGGKLKNVNKQSRYNVRRNFDNVHLNVAFVVTKHTENAEKYLSGRRTKQFDTSSKVNFGVFHHTVDIHNFRFTIIPTPGWFSSSWRGEEAGLGLTLSMNYADISGSSGLMSIGRIEAFDFLVGTFSFRTSLLYHNLGVYQIVYDEFIKPFSLNAWLCTLTFIIIITLFLFLTQNFESNFNNTNRRRYSIHLIMLNILSAFCQQGVTINSKLTTIRSLLFTLLVFTFLWYNYYTSSIVSLLLNNKPETFKDIESVIDSDLTIGIENIAFKRILNATNHPTLRRMQELADKNDSKVDFYPQEVGISKTKNVGFSYFVESISAYNYIGKQFVNDEICNVNEVETLRPTMIYLVAKKRGPFNELLSITYRRFVQYGLVSRQNKIFCDEKPLCLQNKRFIQIGIEQVAPAFIILIFGYLLSIIIFLLEKIIY